MYRNLKIFSDSSGKRLQNLPAESNENQEKNTPGGRRNNILTIRQ
mgnify:CR=1 FL=1